MKLRQLQEFREIEKKLGVKFKNKSLLRKALTHSSSVLKTPAKSNEVLEFLGDAVLELIVREYLLKNYPDKNEGELNNLKKRYTCANVLYKAGKKLGIGNFLIMDKGEELTGGKVKLSNISNGLEALIGAIYLDRGLNYTKKYVKKIILQKRYKLPDDYKSLLNDWGMKNKKEIEYKVLKEEGLPHKKTFFVGLYINGVKVSEGTGLSKKQAEQDSARKFLKDKRLI